MEDLILPTTSPYIERFAIMYGHDHPTIYADDTGFTVQTSSAPVHPSHVIEVSFQVNYVHVVPDGTAYMMRDMSFFTLRLLPLDEHRTRAQFRIDSRDIYDRIGSYLHEFSNAIRTTWDMPLPISDTPESTGKKQSGRPAYEEDAWARKRIAGGAERTKVFEEWKQRRQAAGRDVETLADPKDTFNKAVRPRKK